MKTFALTTLIAVALVALQVEVQGENAAYVCSACAFVFGIVEQIGYQIKLADALKDKCGISEAEEEEEEKNACITAVDAFILKLMTSTDSPDELCGPNQLNLCPSTCQLFPTWPIKLPDEPVDWPIERRRLSSSSSYSEKDHMLQVRALLLSTFSSKGTYGDKDGDGDGRIPMLSKVVQGMYTLFTPKDQEKEKAVNDDTNTGCGHNITCHLMAVANHLPLLDGDGDRFATAEHATLRGSHWRGVDCDDTHNDVYPGRRSTTLDPSVDHNCNGIYGGNESGSYEDLFCKGTEQRGLIMLGDSATAHFHLPPQWLTAKGWNLNQFLADAEDELDKPHCSWGTGHVAAEECPYQARAIQVKSSAAKQSSYDGVLSLYSQLRERNRCNHNDFQNVGVNGARVTSSLGLVDALARSPENDHPVMLWLSLIGNDVCNGHPGYDHMTPPDTFYASAMASLTALDASLPPGSFVFALKLFDGEFLYDIMHAQQHPLGTTYSAFYDFMNCLEENPCWGWLNSNQTVREKTTLHSDTLNDVWRNISHTASFQNFSFVFYPAPWVEIFKSYTDEGGNLVDLIEPGDGFHPSQTGNALFAKNFFAWLADAHPEALGPVNPHNEEIDALFFT